MHLLFLSLLSLLFKVVVESMLFVDVDVDDVGGDGAAGIQSIAGLEVGCGVVVVDTTCCDQSSPSLSTTAVLEEEVADSTIAAAACPLGGCAEDGAPGLLGTGLSLSTG